MNFSSLLPLALCTLASLMWVSEPLSPDCDIAVDAGPDTSLCAPGGIYQLQGSYTGDALFWQWTLPVGLDNPFSLTPNANVSSEITYTLTVYGQDPGAPNLVTNGDFELGDTGFFSDYQYVLDDPVIDNEMWPEGTYSVIPDPGNVHPNFASCDDVSGSGNMMVLNGAPNFQNIWCQNITVNSNTWYNFSAWVASVISASPAQLQFSINNVPIGEVFNATSSTCTWEQFNAVWYSGGVSFAEICILNLNTEPSGNDFALDDISFHELCSESDDVTITIIDEPEPVVEILGDSVLCVNQPNSFEVILPDDPEIINYWWSIPGGGSILGPNNGLTVNTEWYTSGPWEICIDLESRCSTAQECFEVEVLDQPLPPAISGPFELCAGEIATYYVTPPDMVEDYIWDVPGNGIILSGQGSELIEVEWLSEGLYDVCLTILDQCGSATTCLPTDILSLSETIVDTQLCVGQTIIVNGTEYGDSILNGTEILQSSYGCDSTVHISVSAISVIENQMNQNLCIGDSVFLAGAYQYTDGIFVDSFLTIAGCDSLVVTTLTFTDADTVFISGITCDPGLSGEFIETVNNGLCDSTTVSNIAYMGSDTTFLVLSSCNPQDTGLFIQNELNAAGCDSIVVIAVGYSTTDTTHVSAETCDPSLAGTSTGNFVNMFGCDSIVITTTLLVPSDTTYVSMSSCSAIDTGTYIETALNQYNCDSLIITTVTLATSSITYADGFTCDPEEAGEVIDTFANAFGCDSIIVFATMLLPPSFCNIEFTHELVVGCPGESSYISITAEVGVAPFLIDWINTSTDDSGSVSIGQLGDEVQIDLESSGNYVVSVYSSNGLSEDIAYDVSLPEKVSSQITGTMPHMGYHLPCYGDSGAFLELLIDSGGTPPYSVLWSSGDTTFSIQDLGAGTYEVTIEDAMGCEFVSSAVISEPDFYDISTLVTPISCLGSNDGSISIMPSGRSIDELLITVNDAVITDGHLPSLSDGSYFIEVIDQFGCVKTDSVYLVRPQVLNVELPPDTSLHLGSSITLTASVTGTYEFILWTPAICDDCLSIEIAPTESGSYQIEVIDSNGCSAAAGQYIEVIFEKNVYIPNVFSPNGDGANDIFNIADNPSIELVLSLQIFDRWGEMVYALENFDPGNGGTGWDGNFRDHLALPGVYVYVARIKYTDGFEELRKGDVTLIR